MRLVRKILGSMAMIEGLAIMILGKAYLKFWRDVARPYRWALYYRVELDRMMRWSDLTLRLLGLAEFILGIILLPLGDLWPHEPEQEATGEGLRRRGFPPRGRVRSRVSGPGGVATGARPTARPRRQRRPRQAGRTLRSRRGLY
jgi:hypothetical protein